MSDQEQFVFFEKYFNAVNFHVLYHSYKKVDTSWHYLDFQYPFNRLYLVTQADGYIRYKNKTIELRPGWAYLTAADSVCDYVCRSHQTMLSLHFHLYLNSGLEILKSAASEFFYGALPDGITMTDIAKQVSSGSFNDLIDLKGKLFTIIAGMIKINRRHLEKEQLIAGKYKNLFAVLNQTLRIDFPAEQAAQIMNSCYSGFAVQFKKDFGCPFKDYLSDRVMHRAKERLLFTNDKIRTIAYDLGFIDEFYFSRFFKKHENLPPSEYRKNNIMH